MSADRSIAAASDEARTDRNGRRRPRALDKAPRGPAGDEWLSLHFRRDWPGFVSAIAVVAGATAIGWLFYHGLHLPNEARRPLLANTNVLMLYLLGVLWVATRFSRAAAVLASVLGVAAFDFCFVPPYLTFTVHDQQYLVTFAVMLLTALTISTLTHRSRARAREARAASQRADAELLRNTLLSGLSHELRTPLAGITGAASTLIEAPENLTPAARAEMMETILAEAERMERLINNLLEMTRMDAGGLALKKEWQPLQEVVGSALQHLDRRLRGRQVRTNIPPEFPLVCFDAVAIEQVIANLIDNAVEYTPANSPIEINASAGGGQISLEVADRGPGLPPGSEARVFEKFFRICPPQKRRGIGLGLAIARGIVEAHGGRIGASNRPGGGAVFRFTLSAIGEPRVDASA